MAQSPDPPYRSPRREHERQFFYKYVSAEVAKIILTTRKLRWSSPILFNDPFDVNQELPLNFNEKDINEVLFQELASLIERGVFPETVSNPGLAALLSVANRGSPEARTELAKKLRESQPPVTLGQIESLAGIKEKWREIVPSLRILCLSELNNVTPMWQHYADEYSGVVLKFESVDETNSAFLVARQVKYKDFPIDISNVETWVVALLQGEEALKGLINEYQFIKASSWSYEKEWRIASFGNQGETGQFADYDFRPRDLSAIFFGTQCSAEDRRDMLSMLVHGLEHVLPYEAVEDMYQGKFVFKALAR